MSSSFTSNKFPNRLMLIAVLAGLGLVISGAAGAWFAFGILQTHQAIAILAYSPDELLDQKRDGWRQLGRIGPTYTADRVLTPEFAREVGNELKRPQLAEFLPARRFGGKGNISSRLNAVGNSVEVRVSAPTSEEALALAKGISTVVVNLDKKSIQPLLERLTSNLNNLKITQKYIQEMMKYLSIRIERNDVYTGDIDRHKDSELYEFLYDGLVKNQIELDGEMLKASIRISIVEQAPPEILSVSSSRGLIETPLASAVIGAIVGLALFAFFLIAYIRSNDGHMEAARFD